MRPLIFALFATTLTGAVTACSTDTPSPSGPLPGDVLAADASLDDSEDAATTAPDATTRSDAASTIAVDASNNVQDATIAVDPDAAIEATDGAVDDDF